MEDKYFKYIAFGLGIIALILFTAFIYKNFSPPMPENRDAFSQHPGEAVLNNVPNPPLNISGCNTKESCIDYCSYPENARKCLTFLTRRGVNPYVLPDAPGLCQNKEQCEAYCMENFAECEYYKAYEKGIVSGVFDNNYSDIIIPVPSQNQTVKFYKIASSHFGDKNIGREFERFKSMGINSYSFGGGGSYLMGGEFVNDMGIYKEKSANEYGFETRASYYIGKSHLNGFKFVYSTVYGLGFMVFSAIQESFAGAG